VSVFLFPFLLFCSFFSFPRTSLVVFENQKISLLSSKRKKQNHLSFNINWEIVDPASLG